jgi:hypothetical protein
MNADISDKIFSSTTRSSNVWKIDTSYHVYVPLSFILKPIAQMASS